MAEQSRPPNPFARDKNRVVLDMYTIYDHPTDFPDKFVVRRWMIVEGDLQPAAERTCQTADTLEEARKLVPQNYWQVPRMDEDDPKIVETWV